MKITDPLFSGQVHGKFFGIGYFSGNGEKTRYTVINQNPRAPHDPNDSSRVSLRAASQKVARQRPRAMADRSIQIQQLLTPHNNNGIISESPNLQLPTPSTNLDISRLIFSIR